MGTVLQIGTANYVVQMDDGSLLDVEWDSGYDDWSRGDRVMLTTESGGGYMYSESGQPRSMSFPITQQILAISPKMNKRRMDATSFGVRPENDTSQAVSSFPFNGESKVETDLLCEGQGFESRPSRAVRP